MCYGRYQRRIASVAFTISDRERLLAEVKYYGKNMEGQPTVDSLATVYISFLIFFYLCNKPVCVRQWKLRPSAIVHCDPGEVRSCFTLGIPNTCFTLWFSEHLLHSLVCLPTTCFTLWFVYRTLASLSVYRTLASLSVCLPNTCLTLWFSEHLLNSLV